LQRRVTVASGFSVSSPISGTTRASRVAPYASRGASGKADSIGEGADGHGRGGRAPRDREDRAGRRKKAGSRIRTDDRLITNQVLYQLSYTGNLKFNKSPVALLRQGAGGESAAPELWM
jgi:hypothetical protein